MIIENIFSISILYRLKININKNTIKISFFIYLFTRSSDLILSSVDMTLSRKSMLAIFRYINNKFVKKILQTI